MKIFIALIFLLSCAVAYPAAQNLQDYQTEQLKKDIQFVRFLKSNVLKIQKSRDVKFIKQTCAQLEDTIESYQKEYPDDCDMTDILNINEHVYQEGVWMLPTAQEASQEKYWKCHKILARGVLEGLCEHENELQTQINPNWTKKHSRMRKKTREQLKG